jgi:hypothetical protein
MEDVVDYYSLLYLKKMKIYLLKRVPPSLKSKEGEVYYNFLENYNGAKILTRHSIRHEDIRIEETTIDNITHKTLLQPIDSKMTFRLALPNQQCGLRFYLATQPETWKQEGDGVICKILFSDLFMENLFDEVGMVGVEQRKSFLKPRSWFFETRTIYLQYLDPKHNLDERIWHQVDLDLSRFAGKVVEFTFEVDQGPLKDRRFDIALWGEPVIETY